MIKNNFEEAFNEIFVREQKNSPVLLDESQYRNFYEKLWNSLGYIQALDEAMDRYEKSIKSTRKYHLVPDNDGFLEKQENPYYIPENKDVKNTRLHSNFTTRLRKQFNYCPMCGLKIEEIYRFCPECGEEMR